jgi:hypothetical protein
MACAWRREEDVEELLRSCFAKDGLERDIGRLSLELHHARVNKSWRRDTR